MKRNAIIIILSLFVIGLSGNLCLAGDIPYGKKLSLDTKVKPRTIFSMVGDNEQYYILLNLKDIGNQSSVLVYKFEKKIKEIPPEELTADKVNKVLQEMKSTNPNGYTVKGGPFSYSDYVRFVKSLSADKFSLRDGAFFKVYYTDEKKKWFLQTVHHDALISITEIVSEWNSKEFDAYRHSLKEGLKDNFRRIRLQGIAVHARKIHERNIEQGKCIESTLRKLSTKRTIGKTLESAVKLYERCQFPGKGHKRVYVVRKGDTLSGISKKYYGNAKYWKALNRHNFGSQHGDRIDVGQKLAIPSLKKLLAQ